MNILKNNTLTERNNNVKEKYIAPELEMTVFENEDIITTSEYELDPQ